MQITQKSRAGVLLTAAILAQHAVIQGETVRRKGERIHGLNSAPPMHSGRKKIGRNEPCPCGSGQKFKACHLASSSR